jgi:hypothetical protein
VCVSLPTLLGKLHRLSIDSQRSGKHVFVAKDTHNNRRIVRSFCLCVCLFAPKWLLGNNYVKMFPWQRRIIEGVGFYAAFVVSALRMITNAPWYVPNTVIRKDLQIPTVKHEISRYSCHYSKRLSVHPNEVILSLQESPETRRLRKNFPIDLPTRFNM